MISQETWPNHFKALTTFFQTTQSSNYIDLCFYHSFLSITECVSIGMIKVLTVIQHFNSYHTYTTR